MIHGVFGKLGSGKGLYVMSIIAQELIDGFRDIVTNVPIRIVPWVNGQGIPQIGLRAYLLEVLAPLGDDEVDEILKRVYVNEDIDQGHDLYLWRRDGDTGEWFKLPITKQDEKGRPERFDAGEVKRRHCQPCLVVIDEAWAFFPNNGGYARDPVLKFYSKQQRKLRDECYIVTQHPSDCDDVFWKIAQDFKVCRNHGMERMGIFRQPEMFRVITYLTNPAKGNAIRSHETYLTLPKKLAQCYDTTAGVGFSGGHQGDSNQKKKGLHFAWLILAIVLFCGLLASVPYVLSHMTKPFLTRSLSGGRLGNAPSATPAKPVQPIAENAPQATAPGGTAPATNQLYCVSYQIFYGEQPQVTLSDGETVTTPELELIAKSYVMVSGRKIPIRLQPAWTEYVPERQDFEPPPSPAPRPVNQADVTIIGHSARQGSPVPRLNGMASMAGNR